MGTPARARFRLTIPGGLALASDRIEQIALHIAGMQPNRTVFVRPTSDPQEVLEHMTGTTTFLYTVHGVAYEMSSWAAILIKLISINQPTPQENP